MTSKRIAAEVRAIIARDQLSQSVVAKAANLSDSQFSRRLNGHIPFSADEVAAIAKAIGTNVSVLYGETAYAA
ncbi:helix-turn-helix domain-containing protein [Gulosibacter molinativorax]|nr:helix-turn-helix transcriptional regulator [Gulosibacter molinativorax]